MENLNEEQVILNKFMEDLGFIPDAIKLMVKRKGTLNAFVSFRNQIFNNGPLDMKETALIALGVAVALKSNNCIKVNTKKAKATGATEEEIIQAMLIAGLHSGNNPLHNAYSAYFEK